MTGFDPEAHWATPWHGPSARLARSLDRAALVGRLEAVLRRDGAPIAYELFGNGLLLCAPALPDVPGDPDVALVIGDATMDRFFVAQRERGGLGALAVHEGIASALGDFLLRAVQGRDVAALAAWVMGDGPALPPP